MMNFGFYNMDCLDGMKQFPDKYFDLAIVDPPYGDAGQQFLREDGSRFGGRFDRYNNSELGCHFHGRGRSARYFPDGIQKVEKYNSDGKMVERTGGTWAAKVGSASSLIACHRTGHKYVGFEIDKGYYEKAKSRLETETSQMNLFDFLGGQP